MVVHVEIGNLLQLVQRNPIAAIFCYYLVVRRVSESEIKYEKHIPKQQATRTTDSLDYVYYSKCYQNIITHHLSILSQNPAMAIAIAGS